MQTTSLFLATFLKAAVTSSVITQEAAGFLAVTMKKSQAYKLPSKKPVALKTALTLCLTYAHLEQCTQTELIGST